MYLPSAQLDMKKPGFLGPYADKNPYSMKMSMKKGKLQPFPQSVSPIPLIPLSRSRVFSISS